MRRLIVVTTLASLVLAACAAPAPSPSAKPSAQPEVLVWNPLDDFRRVPNGENPSADRYGHDGVWAYLYSEGVEHDPATYSLFTRHTDVGWAQAWEEPGLLHVHVGIANGYPTPNSPANMHAHPYGGRINGSAKFAILRWTNPFDTYYPVRVDGLVANPPSECLARGSGITFSLDKGSRTLATMDVSAGSAAGFDEVANLPPGESLYFVLDPGRDSECDNTYFVLTITTWVPGSAD